MRTWMVAVALIAVLLGGARGQTLVPVYETGPQAERINLVVLSEGYTAAELDTDFPADATRAIDLFLAKEPFATYREYFNAYLISVASAESGADDPSEGIYRDTYFSATFDTAGIDRLLTISSAGTSRANSLLGSLIPQYDIPLVLVNSSQYGGSGGSIPVASTHGSSAEIAIHEIGHSFGDLADEYTTDFASYTPFESPNATARTDRELVRWKHWIDPQTPVPTPDTSQYSGVVGLFEGAMYRSSGWYRPTRNSLMRNLNRPFEEVNEEQLVLRMYGRLPVVSDTTPPVGVLRIDSPSEIEFSLTELLGGGEPGAGVSWYLDGVPVAGQRQEFDLVRRGARWSYRVGREAPPATWNSLGFDASSWRDGPAKLGYGEGDEATLISFGGDRDNKYVTTWFRHEFEVDDPAAFDSLDLELLRDDGAVVYLNGEEIHRANLPSGAVHPDDLAALTVSGSDEDAYFDLSVPADHLVAGNNLIAVEIHQAKADSSDLGFDLRLAGVTEGAGSAAGTFLLDPTRLSDGLHVLEARVVDVSGKVRQDPDDLTRGGATWDLQVQLGPEDSDGDQLPDEWELEQFGDLDEDADGDPDGDGCSNQTERLAGTDPTDPLSKFAIRSVERPLGSDRVTLTWPSVPGRSYDVMRSYDLRPGGWVVVLQVMGEQSPAAETRAEVDIPGGRGEVFFQVRITE